MSKAAPTTEVYFVKKRRLGVGQFSSSSSTVDALDAGSIIKYMGPSLDAPIGDGSVVIASGPLVIGERYKIVARSIIDFDAIGAADNNVGTVFKSTAATVMTSADNVRTSRVLADQSKIPFRFHNALTAYVLKELLPTKEISVIDRNGNRVETVGDYIGARFWESKWDKYIRNGKKSAYKNLIKAPAEVMGPELLAEGN